MNYSTVALLTLALGAGVWPQDDPKTVQEETPTLRFVMHDGSTILGVPEIAEIRVSTKYGPLVVPVRDLRSFTPGLSSKPELLRRIESLIQSLGSEVPDDRDQAEKALMVLGPSVRGEMHSHLKDRDIERRTRVEKILKTFEEMEQERGEDDEAGELSPAWIRDDRLESSNFAMIGDIAPKEFSVKTRYGLIKVALAEIRVVERLAQGGEPVLKGISVDQGDITPKAWKSTGIKVEKGLTVSVTAKGSITMTPWGGGKTCGPEGHAEYGWYNQGSKIEVGSLVGRIGRNGEVFKLGDRRTFTAGGTGLLYVGIAMLPDYVSYKFPGEYQVRIQVR